MSELHNQKNSHPGTGNRLEKPRIVNGGGEGRNLESHILELLDATNLGIISFSPDGTITGINGAAKLLGYSPEDVVGDLNIIDLVDHHESPSALCSGLKKEVDLSALTADVQPGGPKTRPSCFIRKDGTRLFVKTTTTVIPVEDGGLEYLVLVEDVTKRMTAEKELRENRNLLSLVMDSIPSPVFYKDLHGRYVDCNQAFYDYFKTTRDQIISKRVFDIAPIEQAEIFDASDQTVMKSRKKHFCEMAVVGHDGTPRDFICYKAPLEDKEKGSIIGLVGVMLDITDRKQAETALRKRNEQLRMIFETSQGGIVLIGADGVIENANPRMAEMTGFSYDMILGKHYRTLLHPEDRQYGEDSLNCLIMGGKDHAYAERRYVRHDGTVFWGLVSAKRIMNPQGTLDAVVAIIIDVTEAKTARQALEEEQERLAVTLRCIGDGVIAVDTHNNVVLLNEVAESLCGWKQEEARGKPLHQIFRIYNEITKAPVQDPANVALAAGTVVELANHTILVSRDATEKPIEDSAAPIRDNSGTIIGAVLVFRDVSEKKAIQEELFKNRKLESLGVLAGGIAHDFNNLLTGIMGNIAVASRLIAPEEKARHLLDRALKGVERAADLTKQLLSFSKGGLPLKRPTSLSQLIMESANFALRGSNVRCDFDILPDLWPVEVDRGQLSQVINNLVINADQAMPEGGRIIISARNLPDRRGGNNRYVLLNVQDHGVGIPYENLTKIFDPYFTTKPTGNGLGLATVYSIVRNHDGDIRVKSAIGEGTVFSITLPAYEGDFRTVEATVLEPIGGEGRILLMDDEEDIRDGAMQTLAILGYMPATCANGTDAISLYEAGLKEGKPYAAVILDITVPGEMGGKEAARHILKLDPEARIIVSSGYCNDPLISQYADYGLCGVLAKPYSFSAFASAVSTAVKGVFTK